MTNQGIYPIDLNFHGRSGTIAVYLVPHADGCILIEAGPGSIVDNLIAGIKKYGYDVADVTDVFLTHIHLDHAGAAGWWAKHGAKIHVHENGAPHLINPEKLLASAGRLYGDLMHTLWGEFLPVPQESIIIVHDHEVIQVGDICILALDVPGHANHHLAYFIDDSCFSGDIGGIRLNHRQYVRLPMPPPEFYIEKWRESIQRIQAEKPKQIIPTHFGIYPDAAWHLNAVLEELDEVENWIETKLTENITIEQVRLLFIEFEQARAQKYGLDKKSYEAQQIANPSFMSADGIFRYWTKYRKPVA